MKKQKYYSLEPIKKTGAPYRLLIGEKANGKSYAVKTEIITNAWQDTENKFILLRRFELETKQNNINAYFQDPPKEKILEITGGECDGIVAFQGRIYLTRWNDKKQKAEKMRHIGYYMALTSEQHYASGAFPDVNTIVFEEFVSRTGYLPNEPKKLQYFISTIARHREITIYLIGNSISRVCPYFNEWQLTNIPKQKQGTIEIYKQKTNDGTIDIAVEFCANIGYKNKMFFGSHAAAIVTGTWEVDTYPHLQGNIDRDYEKLYTVAIKAKNFTFLATFLLANDTGLPVWYVTPKTTPLQKNTRLITDVACIDDIYVTCGFRALCPEEKIMFDYLFRPDGVCFSDNLTGTDFVQCLKYLRNNAY